MRLRDEDYLFKCNAYSKQIIGAAIEVHRNLGPGLLESAYQQCLCRELSLREIPFEREKILSLDYKGERVECGYRLDLVVADLIVIELKSIESIKPIHEFQLLTYLRFTNLWLGLLINFNVVTLKEGIHRIVN